ncbi:MAG: LysR family transcriptional regulator [Pseudomonadota bacterium]|nr:LysR family transcriptional regulator [Pseudomonadota bacterium]
MRLRVDFNPACSLGPGKISLLQTIGDCGSLAQAARTLGMSYRRAWLLVDNLNTMFDKRVTTSATGGRRGGGMIITPFGESVISMFRQLEKDLARQAKPRLAMLSKHVAIKGTGKTSPPRRAMSRRR